MSEKSNGSIEVSIFHLMGAIKVAVVSPTIQNYFRESTSIHSVNTLGHMVRVPNWMIRLVFCSHRSIAWNQAGLLQFYAFKQLKWVGDERDNRLSYMNKNEAGTLIKKSSENLTSRQGRMSEADHLVVIITLAFRKCRRWHDHNLSGTIPREKWRKFLVIYFFIFTL